MLAIPRFASLSMIVAISCAPRTRTAAPEPQVIRQASLASAPQTQVSEPERRAEPRAESSADEASPPLQQIASPPECREADWSAQPLAPLLVQGQGTPSSLPDRDGSAVELFEAECTDAPSSPSMRTPAPAVVDGVQITVSAIAGAGLSGRHWAGNRCEFELRLADGGGTPVVLGASQVPPFNTIRAVVRSGAAVWLSIGFNGYTREFPRGGNRILAVDLCRGRVIWQSRDGSSNAGLLLLDGYLVAPYGFTGEARYVSVFDAHSGSLVQRLPVVENVCPSKRWLPNWTPGERCDAPGQRVGAASQPRIEEGVFMVDTNTGSSKFYLRMRNP